VKKEYEEFKEPQKLHKSDESPTPQKDKPCISPPLLRAFSARRIFILHTWASQTQPRLRSFQRFAPHHSTTPLLHHSL
jgi:hypothetical protein